MLRKIQSVRRCKGLLLLGWFQRSFVYSEPGAENTIYDVVSSSKLDQIPTSHIRNFSVIAHVDHGKSTLSDAILQETGNISEEDRKGGQVCDTLTVERERGITVKAQTASMIFSDTRTNELYLFNLIDTPGHIDFSYEVSRSLASCQGALLLVDSTQSIQAQTLATHGKAKSLGLGIIPVVTKIDLPGALIDETALAMSAAFDFCPSEVIMTSAKNKMGVREVLEAIVDRLPYPGKRAERERIGEIELLGEADDKFLGRVVDSWFDEHRGVVSLIQAVSGTITENQKVTNYASAKETKDIDPHGRTEFSVQDIGLLTPHALRTKSLRAGQVGYVIAGLRSTRQARLGDTMFIPSQHGRKMGAKSNSISPLPGYETAKPMLFASVFPVDTDQVDSLYAAVDRLALNDSSLSITKDQSSSLGAGLRCGFLGFLHMEVFNQRLSDEFGMQTVLTSPSVPYLVETTREEKDKNGKTRKYKTEHEISSVADWPQPDRHLSYKILEPIVKVRLVCPQQYYGAMAELIKRKRGDNIEALFLDDGGVVVSANVPWQEVVCDMHDAVKNDSSGYASFNYEEAGHVESNLVKVEIAVNGEACDPLSFVCHTSQSERNGRQMATKLKEVLNRQNFEIVLQAKVGNKVLARERIAPYRKDVLTKGGKTVGGGDITRKKKLLEKQKAGKKRAKMVGKVEISQDAFWSVLQR